MTESYYVGELGPAEVAAAPAGSRWGDPVVRLLRLRFGSQFRREGARLMNGSRATRLFLTPFVMKWLERWQAGLHVPRLGVWVECRPTAAETPITRRAVRRGQ